MPSAPLAAGRRLRAGGRDSLARLRRSIGWPVAALLLVIWALFAHSSWQRFALDRQAAYANTGTLAKLVEAWALSTLGRINDLTAGVEFQVAADAAPARIAELLERQRAADVSLFRAIDVLDPDGHVIASTPADHGAAASRNFDSDRDFGTMVRIGLPRRVGRAMLIPITRPLSGARHEALGAIVVEVDPNYFAGFYSDLGLPADASVQLFRSDGPLLARNQPLLGAVGRSYPEIALWRHLAEAPSGGYEETEGDGVTRLISYRTNGVIPLVVTIGFGAEQVFAGAWRYTLLFGLVCAVLSAALVVVTLMISRQLTRRAATERALAISAAAVTSVGSGVVIVRALNDEQRIFHCNPAFLRLTARSLETVIGQAWSDVAGSEAGDLETLGETTELRFARAGATAFWAELRIARIHAELGQGAYYVAVVTDIAVRKDAEEALIRAKEEAVAASRAKSEFLANISHELRTPLNAIIGFSDVIATEMLGPVGTARYREYAGDINDSGTHLLAIITDILDLAKIEASRVTLDEREIDVEHVFAACAMLVGARAAQAGVRVEHAVARDLPLLLGDELRIKQIVLNLLSNAVKFSSAGTTVHLEGRLAEDGGIVITVADQGCGMTEDELALALEPFRQVNASIAKRAEGTGLGLPLALRLAELHGGTLALDSAPQRGTVATVRFPPGRTCALPVAAD
jgi:signal transduction histidine kinase